MKDTHKIYEAPTLKAVRLGTCAMMKDSSITPSSGADHDHNDSKAFWGPSLFDEEDEEEYVDEIVP